MNALNKRENNYNKELLVMKKCELLVCMTRNLKEFMKNLIQILFRKKLKKSLKIFLVPKSLKM